jgi:hypothetical protein
VDSAVLTVKLLPPFLNLTINSKAYLTKQKIWQQLTANKHKRVDEKGD